MKLVIVPNLFGRLGVYVPLDDVASTKYMDIPCKQFAMYKVCYQLLDELNVLVEEKRSKADFQDVVRRLFIVVSVSFMRDEQASAQLDHPDTQSRRKLHSEILARYLRISDELDSATNREDWVECGSVIVRELTKDLDRLQTMDGTRY